MQANATRPSARGPAVMKQVHLHPESRQMSHDHQQEDLQPWNRFTYNLKAGKWHKTIRPSAMGPAVMKQVHLLPEYRQMPQGHQQVDLQPWSRFTYILKGGKCHKSIGKRSCSHKTGSLTVWTQTNLTRPLEREPAAIKKFIYKLKAGKCHMAIRKMTCSHETSALTYWTQANVTRPSEREPAIMKQVHLQTESREMPQDDQQEDSQPWVHLLPECSHKTIRKRTQPWTGSLTCWQQANATKSSERGPAAMKQVHLLPKNRQMQQDHQ
jgi:hypothetical protein